MLYSFDGREPKIGNDTYIGENALVIGDVKIGNNCYIGHGAILRGDYGTIEIGNGTSIEEGVIVHAPPKRACSIGARVTVGHGAVIHCKSIGNSVVIGMGAVLGMFAEIGEWAIVAEGSIVKMWQKIPAGMVVAGNPAKEVREVSVEDKKNWDWGKELYIDLAKKYLTIGMKRLD
ncbi:MAG: gamma carbonic anhydrase family protein [Chloroflexi bacterium]|nr:gamma carbonic anhydrase family protein [Chloroflexota bacterium]